MWVYLTCLANRFVVTLVKWMSSPRLLQFVSSPHIQLKFSVLQPENNHPASLEEEYLLMRVV